MGKIKKSDKEWRDQLSDQAYKVTRQHATERAFTNETFPVGPGQFCCVCCGAPLFEQAAKFDSGTGWPSFFQPTNSESIGETEDRGWLGKRTEVHCNQCEAHLGHVFDDGPAPTGLRYCVNGAALEFKP